jgi:hypothetical protein
LWIGEGADVAAIHAQVTAAAEVSS